MDFTYFLYLQQIQFEPDINETQIQICSINLRVGKTFNRVAQKDGVIINPSQANSEGLFESVIPAQDIVTAGTM
jgi:deoxycytidine triphosphate deaminase